MQNFDHRRKEHQKLGSGNRLGLGIRKGGKKYDNDLKIKNKCYCGARRAGGSMCQGPGVSEQPGQGREGNGTDWAAPALDVRNLCEKEGRLRLG